VGSRTFGDLRSRKWEEERRVYTGRMLYEGGAIRTLPPRYRELTAASLSLLLLAHLQLDRHGYRPGL
jgi:hypothetical protein